jgi:hypothetical protein
MVPTNSKALAILFINKKYFLNSAAPSDLDYLIVDPSKPSYITSTIDSNYQLSLIGLNNNSSLGLNSIEKDFATKNPKEINLLGKNISDDKTARLISQSQFLMRH